MSISRKTLRGLTTAALFSLLCLSGFAPKASAQTTVYSNNFESGNTTGWSSSSITTNPGGTHGVTHFLGEFANATQTLSLSNLPAHSLITVTYDFYAIRSWDGNGEFGGGPDYVTFGVDNIPVLYSNVACYSGDTQSYPATFNPGSVVRNAPYTGSAEQNSLGYTYSGSPMDAVYHFSFTVPHDASSVTLSFGGLTTEDITNESWGIDNVVVSVSNPTAVVVQLPSTANIFGSGHSAAPAPCDGNGGTMPPFVAFPAGTISTITFPNVVGITSPNSNGNIGGPDGYVDTSMNVSAYQGISGFIVDSNHTLPLVGVFTTDAQPTDPPPATLDFTNNENFTTLSPVIDQVFFIGDGYTDSGALQQFTVPPTATHLYLGFADACGYNGSPGAYSDNRGAVSVLISGLGVPAALKSVSPAKVNAGGPNITLIVKGTGIVNGATVNFNGSPLTTTFVSATELKAALPSADTASAGKANISVSNPGASPSNARPLTIVVTTLKLLPASVSKNGSGNYLVTVNIKNTGYQTAPGLKITKATLNNVATTTTLPVSLGDLAASATTNTTLTFPASSGISGSTVVFKVLGTFTGGKLSGSVKVTLP